MTRKTPTSEILPPPLIGQILCPESAVQKESFSSALSGHNIWPMKLREGFKENFKKWCRFVTTPVHLPTYPYWCKEGNFFMFFACLEKSIFD